MRSFLAAVLLSSVGCATLMNFGAVKATNPLTSNTALTWSKEPQGIPFEGQKACQVWPINSSISVTATDDQICVDAKISRVADSGIDMSQDSELSVTSDGSLEKKGGMAGQFTDSFKATPNKVGTCTDSTRGLLGVWVSSFKSCVANKDMSGKPVLTKDSSYLRVGDAKWTFPTPTAPAAAPAAPATASAAPTT
jgi:hypothetical protein